MWGVNKLLTTVAVALCFFTGAAFERLWLMLLSVLIALGAWALECYPLHRRWGERRTSRRRRFRKGRTGQPQSLGRTKTSKPPPPGSGTMSPAGSKPQPAEEGQVAEIWSRFVR